MISRAACGPQAACLRPLIYMILCVVCLTTTCCQNTRFRTAADPLNNDQRYLLLLVCKNVGYDVQTLLLQKLSTILTQKRKRGKVRKQEQTISTFKLTAQRQREYFDSPELCHFTMTIFVPIHISQRIPYTKFPYVIAFNSTDWEKRISYTCQFNANVLVIS